MSQLMKNKVGQQVKPYAKGGAVHDDVAADRALLKKAVKPAALTGKKKGGSIVRDEFKKGGSCKKCGGKVCKC